MQFRFFSIPVQQGQDSASELNRFLSGHRILAVERHLIPDGANSTWAICVAFDENSDAATPRLGGSRRGKVDYKDVLTDPEFAVFARLRALRKEISEREGIAAYAIFTNDQLAQIVRGRIASLAGLRQIPGVGEARAERYGAAFLTIVQEAALPAGGVVGDAPVDTAGADEA